MLKKPDFDVDQRPEHPNNKEAAKSRGLRYDTARKQYLDVSGCPTHDRFGQPL